MYLLKENIIIEPNHKKKFLLDIHGIVNGIAKPVIIFSHGFKGFKNWGFWGEMGNYFAKKGYVFIKFNFSHNGTTLDYPSDFNDLKSFGNNNFSKELSDLDAVIDWVFDEDNIFNSNFDLGKVTLMGHSRGGPISILKAAYDERITSLITLASVDCLNYAWKKSAFVETWRIDGSYIIKNGRTKQDMPLYFQLYENYIENEHLFDLEKASKGFCKPFLIIHGAKDFVIPIKSAQYLNSIFQDSKLVIVKNADHVFNGSHPFAGNDLPLVMKDVLGNVNEFLEKT